MPVSSCSANSISASITAAASIGWHRKVPSTLLPLGTCSCLQEVSVGCHAVSAGSAATCRARPTSRFRPTLVFEKTDFDSLDELVGYPCDEELQLLNNCGTASPSWDTTTASSFGIETTHSPQQLLLADPQPLLPNAKERTKELNRRHQKRFRER